MNRYCKRQVKKNLELKKLSKEKLVKYISNAKYMIAHLIAGSIKKM